MDRDTLLQGHCGSVVHLQTSSQRHTKVQEGSLGLQTVGSRTQRTYGLYHSPKCCWLEWHGLREADGPLKNRLDPHVRTYGVTALILTKPGPRQAGERLIPLVSSFIPASPTSLPPANGAQAADSCSSAPLRTPFGS